MQLVVFTAMVGATDAVLPVRPEPDIEFVCFTDGTERVPGWRMERIDRGNPRATARSIKVRPDHYFPDAEWSLWVDASFRFLVPAAEILRAGLVTGCSIVGFRHPDRQRITDEARSIIRAAQAPAGAVTAQVAAYQREGFDTPENPQRVITTTGLLLRQRTPEVAAFNALWSEQLQLTLRDQLSIDYCAWRRGIPIGYWSGHYRDNPLAAYERRGRARRKVA